MKGKGVYMSDNLEQIIQEINNSSDYYVRNQRKRIFFTIDLAKRLDFFSKNGGECLVVGGGEWNLFNELYSLSFPKVKFINSTGDLHDPLPYADCTFDNVLFTEVFEHIGDRNFMSSSTNFSGVFNLCAQIARVLKESGRCLMSTPNVTSLASLSLILRGTHPFTYPLHYREYNRYELEKILSCIGVKIIYFGGC